MSTKQVSEVPSGLEVGSPPSRGNSNPFARKPVPSYAAASSMQDGTSQYPYSEDGRYTAGGEGYSKPHRNPCGLSPLLYGLLVGLITMVVIGAALGGGLGASLASAQSKNVSAASSSSTSSTTTTSSSSTTTSSTPTSTTASATVFSNYAVLRPTDTSDTVALPACPNSDGRNYATARGQNFLLSCNEGLSGYDLVGMLAYTSDDCIEACSSFNAFNGTNACIAITFTDKIYSNWNQHANCWLKYAISITGTDLAGSLSAALQG